MPESIESSKFASHKAKLVGDFDSRKDSHSTKFDQITRIFAKPSFRESCDSKLLGLHPFVNMAIIQ